MVETHLSYRGVAVACVWFRNVCLRLVVQLPTKAPPRGASKAVLASAKPGAASPARENGMPAHAEERQGLPPLSVQQPAGPYPHAESSGGQLSPLGQGQQARVFAPGGVHLQYMFFTTEKVKGQTPKSQSTVQYMLINSLLLLFVCHLCAQDVCYFVCSLHCA